MKWLTLSEGLYLFGENAINRIELIDSRDHKDLKYRTILYHNTTKITVVKETIEEIVDKLSK